MNRRQQFALLGSVVSACLSSRLAHAQFPPAGTSQPANAPFTPPVTRPADELAEHTRVEQLGNGLRLLIVEDHAFPLISVQTWLRVGSAADGQVPATCDISRALLEHRDEGALRLRAAGVHFSSRTLPDACVFESILPADENLLQYVLDVEARRFAPLRVTADAAARAARAARIEREFKPLDTRAAAAGSRAAFKLLKLSNGDSRESSLSLSQPLCAKLFTGHAYASAATPSETEAVPAAQLDDFVQTWFVPANATVVIVGDVALVAALELARSRFAAAPLRDRPRRPAEDFPEAQRFELAPTSAELTRATAMEFAWQTPYYADFANVAIEVLMHRLCNPVDGPLHDRLTAAGCAPPLWHLDRWRDAGVLLLRVDLAPPAGDAEASGNRAAAPPRGVTAERIAAVRATVASELQRAADARPSEIELIRARRLAARDAQRQRRGFAEYAALLGRHEVIGGDVLLAEFEESRAQRVTVGTLQDAAALLAETSAVSRVVCEEPRDAANAKSPKTYQFLGPDETLAALQRGAAAFDVRPPPAAPESESWTSNEETHVRGIRFGRAGATLVVRGNAFVNAAGSVLGADHDPRFWDVSTFRGFECGLSNPSDDGNAVTWWTPDEDELDTLLEFAIARPRGATSAEVRSPMPDYRIDIVSSLPLCEQRAAAARGLAEPLRLASETEPRRDDEDRPPGKSEALAGSGENIEITITFRLDAHVAAAAPGIERVAGRLFGLPETVSPALDGDRAARWRFGIGRGGRLTLHARATPDELDQIYRAVEARLAAIRAQQIPEAELAAAVRLARADQYDDFASDLAVSTALARRPSKPGLVATQPTSQRTWAQSLADALRGSALVVHQYGGADDALRRSGLGQGK